MTVLCGRSHTAGKEGRAAMAYRQTTTACVVRLLTAGSPASAATPAQCQALRAEAGGCWTDLVTLHAQRARRDSGSRPASWSRRPRAGSTPCTARACRRSVRSSPPTWTPPPNCGGRSWPRPDTSRREYPHHPKVYQTVVWKDQALTVLPAGSLRLPTGGQRPPAAAAVAGGVSAEPTCVGRS